VILTQVFKRQTLLPSLLGPAGLATLPLVIGLLSFIGPLDLAFSIFAVAGALQLTQVALQDATDAPAGEVFIASFAGFLAFGIVLFLLGGGDRGYAPGPWFGPLGVLRAL
jgi:hypothetical protein